MLAPRIIVRIRVMDVGNRVGLIVITISDDRSTAEHRPPQESAHRHRTGRRSDGRPSAKWIDNWVEAARFRCLHLPNIKFDLHQSRGEQSK